jgi:thimet oligopeptidase
MKPLRGIVTALAVTLLVGEQARTAPPFGEAAGRAPFYAGIGDPASFKEAMDARLARTRETLERLTTLNGPRTVENTLRAYDDLKIELDSVAGPSSVVSAVHPDEAMRRAAESTLEQVRTFGSELSLNRAVYDALAATSASRADADTKRYLELELRDFRLGGVDKDEATRERLKQLRTDLAAAAQEFLRNVRSNKRTIAVKNAEELAGLPSDYIARHTPNADGTITLDTNDADVRPLLTFAKSEDVRKRMYMEWTNVGYPANDEVLQKMVALRAEIARLLGYPNWAALDMVDRMSGSAKAASEFIDRVVEASERRASREFDEVLKRKQQDVPGATNVNAWENTYYGELVRRSNYSFDSQSVRAYFPYDRVRQGVFDVTSALYGVTYRPAPDAPVWHSSVEPYEVLENGTVVGRFYLDLHPRPNKANTGASTATVRSGAAGRQLPEAVLIASMPGGQPGDPGLMTHDEVTTFFHEFGHLVHTIMAGRHEWVGLARVRERDFIEAPSQMFEEWTWDPATLATFARHYQSNEPIPAPLVAQMRRASEFGKGIGIRAQMVFAKLSLSLHDRDPNSVDSTVLMRDLTNKYLPYKYVEGTHRQAAFTHLANPNYSASYYTYMWSLVIAKDFFSQFDASNLLAAGVARRYRDTVLAPGGSKPAAALARDFLGRPFNAKAWEKWLNE